MPLFKAKNIIPIIIHEYCHAYCNPLNGKFTSEQKDAGERIFDLTGPLMTRMAYGHWTIVLNEAFVRASVVKYIKEKSFDISIDKAIRDEIHLGFFWIPRLISLLDEYSGNRTEYAKMEDFMPQIISFYNNLDFSDFIGYPKVESCSIENGSLVDAELEEILIRFDRPMKDKGYGFSFGKGGQENFPELKSNETVWLDNRTLKVGVGLIKNNYYSFVLYKPSYEDTKGYPLV